jgi:hypothetical protein
MKKTVFAIILFCVFFTANVYAENIYVSQSGTGDGSSCSSPKSAAWFNTSGNWGDGVGKISAGDTVYLCGTITTNLSYQGSGASQNYVIVDGTNATLSCRVYINHVSWWKLQNCTWSDSYSTGALISIDGGNNGIVKDNYANNYTARGVFIAKSLEYAYNITIQNNFFRTSDSGSTSENDMIATEGSYDVIIEGNYFEHRLTNNDQHIDILQTWPRAWNLSNQPYNWTIRFNKFVLNTTTAQNNKSWMMIEGLAGSNYIYGNVFLAVSGGSDAQAGVMTGSAGTFYFYNNTVVSLNGAGNQLVINDLATAYYTRNNLVSSSTVTAFKSATSPVTRDHNLWYGSNIPSCSGLTGEICNQDPKFIDAANHDFYLQSSSPAIGVGTNLGTGPSGHSFNYGVANGSTWPNPTLVARTVWDIGAYVYSSDDVTAPSVTTVSVSGSTATINFSKTVVTTGYDTGDFNLDCTSPTLTNVALSSPVGSGLSRTFTIATPIVYGQTCNLDYIGTAGDITDAADPANDMVAINDIAVTNSTPADTTPDLFTFTDETGVPISTVKTSNTITVAGINSSAAVSVTGGTYSKNGTAYTSSAGTAVLNDTFAVRQTSSASYLTTTSVILNIGGVTDTYSVTTTSGNDAVSPVVPNGLIMGNGVLMR